MISYLIPTCIPFSWIPSNKDDEWGAHVTGRVWLQGSAAVPKLDIHSSTFNLDHTQKFPIPARSSWK